MLVALALALVAVVTYHQFGWRWLRFPVHGRAVAVAGSLIARSLTQTHGYYWTVLLGQVASVACSGMGLRAGESSPS